MSLNWNKLAIQALHSLGLVDKKTPATNPRDRRLGLSIGARFPPQSTPKYFKEALVGTKITVLKKEPWSRIVKFTYVEHSMKAWLGKSMVGHFRDQVNLHHLQSEANVVGMQINVASVEETYYFISFLDKE